MRAVRLALTLMLATPGAVAAAPSCLWLDTPQEQLACRAQQCRKPKLCATITDRISRAACVEDASRRR